jgi:hypothetical protein
MKKKNLGYSLIYYFIDSMNVGLREKTVKTGIMIKRNENILDKK